MKILDNSIFTFFNSLKNNNNREWFQEHKPEFKEIERQVKEFGKTIFDELTHSEHLDTVKLFRIYRDVRFSKNKTPYKTHFGVRFSRRKPAYRGGYYLHIEPNNSFLAIGFWKPSPADLLRIRKELELDAEELVELMNNEKFKKHWGDLVGDQVKTAPKGFSKEHKNIELLRKKQYLFTKKFTDKEVLSASFSKTIIEDFKAAQPFFNYMSSVLTTNLNGESLID